MADQPENFKQHVFDRFCQAVAAVWAVITLPISLPLSFCGWLNKQWDSAWKWVNGDGEKIAGLFVAVAAFAMMCFAITCLVGYQIAKPRGYYLKQGHEGMREPYIIKVDIPWGADEEAIRFETQEAAIEACERLNASIRQND